MRTLEECVHDQDYQDWAKRTVAEAVAAERETTKTLLALAKADEVAAVAAERERCNAEIELLREALRPLAEAAEEVEWTQRKGVDAESTFLWACNGGSNPKRISVGDALRAREALARSAIRKGE